ncbi:MAG: sulfatase-like hydrolase/transferase [Anaerolineae bacterium]|nr:sulfatase-like hydrolase/transferase [Anaerolineae bacterium]
MTKISRRDFLKLGGLSSLSLSQPNFSWLPTMIDRDINKQNILIIVFDTLSAENISLYGYARETMPNLSRIADRATVYHQHYAGGPFTTPGTASLLTGTYPWTHRAFGIQGKVIDKFIDKNIFSLFSDYYRFAYSHNPVANTLLRQFSGSIEEYLKMENLFLNEKNYVSQFFENDFDTAWFAQRQIFNNTTNYGNSLFLPELLKPLIERKYSLEQIKQKYEEKFPRGIPNMDNDNLFVIEDAVDWMSHNLVKFMQPYLAYFHFYPPHAPYNTRIEFVDKFMGDGWEPVSKPKHFFGRFNPETHSHTRRIYDEFILYVDAEFGRLFKTLESRGILENTWVIFTSDHGELNERGIQGHVREPLFQGVVRIPLLIIEPGQTKRKDVYTNTSCVDLIPTLLHITGKTKPDWMEGEILPPYRGENINDDRSIYILQARSNRKTKPLTVATATMIKGDYKISKYFGYNKLIEKRNGNPLVELFDKQNDPEEINNLVNQEKDIAREMLNNLEEKLAESDEPYH